MNSDIERGMEADLGKIDMARYRVHLVVDRAFEANIWQLPRDEPVWIIDTAANERSISDMRKSRADGSHLTGLTTFEDSPHSSAEEVAANELAVIDLHHGEYSSDPPYDSLHVIGARKSPELLAAAELFGFVGANGQDFDFELRRLEFLET